jgi:hypothetical protein
MQITPDVFDHLLNNIEQGNKEFHVGKYYLIYRYATVVQYFHDIYNYKKEREINDIKDFKVSMTLNDIKYNIDRLTFDAIGLHEDFVTQIILDKQMSCLYVSPQRSKMVMDDFIKTLYGYVKTNKMR